MAESVAYLGPEGTYSHLVAEKRYGRRARLVPQPTILDVCTLVAKGKAQHGIVPIENSSGGTIYETVDILLANRPAVHIAEEITLDVKLALIGQRGEEARVLYSHFAPLEHCRPWLERHLPGVECRTVPSTATAAEHAARERHAVALGGRRLAALHGLQVLRYPVEAETPNETVFLAIGHRPHRARGATHTTLAVKLPNKPGSLCTFLEAFRDNGVNLSRIVSRPLRGCPREYAFLVDIDGTPSQPRARRALEQARAASAELRIAGIYPARRRYQS